MPSLDPPPRVMKIKISINKWNLIKLEIFNTSKKITNKIKKNNTQNEKKSICKQISHQRIKLQNIPIAHTTQYEINNPIKKWVQGLHRCFSKDIQMANRHMKRCSTSLVTREMQIKTAMRNHLTSIRMDIIKKSINNKCWRGFERKRNFPTLLVLM